MRLFESVSGLIRPTQIWPVTLIIGFLFFLFFLLSLKPIMKENITVQGKKESYASTKNLLKLPSLANKDITKEWVQNSWVTYDVLSFSFCVSKHVWYIVNTSKRSIKRWSGSPLQSILLDLFLVLSTRCWIGYDSVNFTFKIRKYALILVVGGNWVEYVGVCEHWPEK